MRTIHDEMRGKTELAFCYAEDGATATAARLFQEVADLYRSRANEIAAMLDAEPIPDPFAALRSIAAAQADGNSDPEGMEAELDRVRALAERVLAQDRADKSAATGKA